MIHSPEQDSPDPAAAFLAIQSRLRECRLMNEKMPAAEASLAFTQLYTACQQLISTNERLRSALAISEQIVSELEIDLTIKDIEIFNFTNHSEEKDNN
jgi:hypothetical protein